MTATASPDATTTVSDLTPVEMIAARIYTTCEECMDPIVQRDGVWHDAKQEFLTDTTVCKMPDDDGDGEPTGHTPDPDAHRVELHHSGLGYQVIERRDGAPHLRAFFEDHAEAQTWIIERAVPAL